VAAAAAMAAKDNSSCDELAMGHPRDLNAAAVADAAVNSFCESIGRWHADNWMHTLFPDDVCSFYIEGSAVIVAL